MMSRFLVVQTVRYEEVIIGTFDDMDDVFVAHPDLFAKVPPKDMAIYEIVA